MRVERSALKKACLLLALFCCLLNLNAQEKGNTKLALEIGPLLSAGNAENLSFFFNVEPKVKVVDNFFVGLRFGVVVNATRYENNDVFQFNIDDEFDNGVISFVPNVDYYLEDLRLKENIYRPYLGVGLGYYLTSDVEVFRLGGGNPEEPLEVSIKKLVGFLLRGGFEMRKLRVGLEYTFLPEADIILPGEETVGTLRSSFLGLSVGLLIGGGKRP